MTDEYGCVINQCKSVALHRIDERNAVVVLGEIYVGLGVALGILCEESDSTVAIDRA